MCYTEYNTPVMCGKITFRETGNPCQNKMIKFQILNVPTSKEILQGHKIKRLSVARSLGNIGVSL